MVGRYNDDDDDGDDGGGGAMLELTLEDDGVMLDDNVTVCTVSIWLHRSLIKNA